MSSILIVDDERSMRDFLKILLEKNGHEVSTAANGAKALNIIKQQKLDVVVSDIRMPDISGIELLQTLKDTYPELPVVLITAFASPNDAILAMKYGAFDYITKPFDVTEIQSVIESASNKKLGPTKPQDLCSSFPEIIGKSRKILKIFDTIKHVAPTRANILIHGESGTGKELVAKAIHNHSNAIAHKFIPISCSTIPEDLMESELFGHVKGSFTGAIADKPGLFNEADLGTAFLDEIGELPLIIQIKLLRVLQEREIKPVGGIQTKRINVRIIAATNKVLEEEIQAGRFREDLFYRLAVIPIRLPSLRERKDDIPLLVDHFLNKHSRLLGKEIQAISSYALQVLMNYDFPGNIRELENIIERGVAMENSTIILPKNLEFGSKFQEPEAIETAAEQSNPSVLATTREEELYDLGIEKVLANLEKKFISYALKNTNNSKMKAANLLQVSFRSLRYKVKKYSLD